MGALRSIRANGQLGMLLEPRVTPASARSPSRMILVTSELGVYFDACPLPIWRHIRGYSCTEDYHAKSNGSASSALFWEPEVASSDYAEQLTPGRQIERDGDAEVICDEAKHPTSDSKPAKYRHLI